MGLSRSTSKRWKVNIDTGGTFTDCLAENPDGLIVRTKVLSSSSLRGRIEKRLNPRCFRIQASWSDSHQLVKGFWFQLFDQQHPPSRVVSYSAPDRLLEVDLVLDSLENPGAIFEVISPEPAPVLATRLVTQTPPDRPLPPLSLRLATTWGTNALLTRSGTPPVLFITKGFTDLLEIGNQTRPDLFALKIEKPKPLYALAVEVAGRLSADGQVIEAVDIDRIAAQARDLTNQGHRAAAVALLHSDKNPIQEAQVAACLQQAGFTTVSRSADLSAFIKILPRAETAVTDAYLAPLIGAYLDCIRSVISRGEIFVMTSAGGLMRADSYRAKDSLLSGPAGGIAGAAWSGRTEGFDKLIAFDMGGTSTDVSRFDGDFEYVFEHQVGDANLSAPALAIESVAAGGGSICSFDGTRLKVGPESAEARPGPSCYGAGGPFAITDVNLLLGRIDPNRFEIPIFPKAAQQVLYKIRHDLQQATGELLQPEELLEGFLELANQKMSDAIRSISLRMGYDPAEYALIAFGGAGPQHALAVADRLCVSTVIIPPHSAVLSAYGLSGAVVERFAEKQLLKPVLQVEPALPEILDQLFLQAKQRLCQDGVRETEVVLRRRLASLRYFGQDATLEVEADPHQSLIESFETSYRQTFGHCPEGRDIEVVGVRVIASTQVPPPLSSACSAQTRQPTPTGHTQTYLNGYWMRLSVYQRDSLQPGHRFLGPCLIVERYTSSVIEEGWQVEVSASLALIITRFAQSNPGKPTARSEAFRLELFTHRFEAIAREMGESLRRTAVSTNIKERLDFSCALLDSHGELVVNAPHIPVHLGSLGLCVRKVANHLSLQPGDTVVTNHPGFGGSHLPDVTLISPVFVHEELLGYVASRAHHAEIGGILPGSMPPRATRLVEEGVVISPFVLARDQQVDWDQMRRLLTDTAYPTRALQDNLADLRAALAANHTGVTAFARLGENHSAEVVADMMQAMKIRAETKLTQALKRLGNGTYTAREILDDGHEIRVHIEIKDGQARFDFEGSSGVHPGNLNATPAVVRSVVLYVLRLLIDEPLPLNEGLMKQVELHIPPGILNPIFPDDISLAPAIVGGNVECSQRLANALLRALGLCASSQGTMNNLLFGNQQLSYYETICGGCGAGPGFKGASAVHSHMTNTRITDPEVLEQRYPVRLESFSIRRGSGGAGLYPGGDGVVRKFRFLQPMSLSILSQHRRQGPEGLKGGSSGLAGAQYLIRAGGKKQRLDAVDSAEVRPDDVLIVETPGGGGFGSASEGSL